MYLLFFSIFFFLFVSLFFRFVLFRISLSDTCFLKSSPRSKTDCIYDNEHFDIKKSSLLHVGVDRVFVVHKTYRLCPFSFFFQRQDEAISHLDMYLILFDIIVS